MADFLVKIGLDKLERALLLRRRHPDRAWRCSPAASMPIAAGSTFFVRWLHVLSGVMWIGLLWYFNFVQIPSMPKIPDEQKPAISKVIAPTALFWFRWAALVDRASPA